MLKHIAAVTAFFCFTNMLGAQLQKSFRTDKWKGFERVNFSINNHEAYYVKPLTPLTGNPWVWRSSFPDWHTEMDSLLLVKGFYVAYLNIDNQYGSPYSMQLWDRLYNYLTDSLSFSKKVALEAVSRGGLYAYGWAKRNPASVSCIYAETPVCDVKSWPGGKGKGIGDSASWKQFLEVFSFTEEQALAYHDNPVNNLEGLASYKVPVLHVIGINDKVVPNDENTYALANNYAALGGPVSIYPVTAGPQELYGHHVPVEHADKWADFIISNTWPVKNPLPLTTYMNERQGLKNSYAAINKNKSATVAFLGGSITYNPGWRDKVCKYLQERFPETKFRFIAAGVPSLGSLPHVFRMQSDILDSGKVDLLFVEAAVNDRTNETDSITQVRDLEGIVMHAKKANPLTDIILMSFADPDKTKDYNNNIQPVEITNHELVAQHYGLPSLNLAKEVSDKLNSKEFSWEYDFKDLHPSPFGQELYFAAMKKLLAGCYNKADESSTKTIPAITISPLNKASFSKGNYASIQHAKYGEGWKIEPDWTPADGLGTREGFVHKPMLTSGKPGSALSFDFDGTAVGIAIVSGGDAGIISYSIDNDPFKKKDLFTQWSGSLHLPWYILLGSDLKDKKHTLHIKIAGEHDEKSKGNACRIVYFLVNG